MILTHMIGSSIPSVPSRRVWGHFKEKLGKVFSGPIMTRSGELPINLPAGDIVEPNLDVAGGGRHKKQYPLFPTNCGQRKS